MANASSALNRAVSYHIDHYSAEVAKLVMWITNAGFGNDVGSEKIKSLGVLIKKVKSAFSVKKDMLPTCLITT